MALGIKELTESYEISFENLLAGLAREEILKKLAQSVFGRYLWLCKPENLGIEAYKKNIDRQLRFAYEQDEKVVIDGRPGARLNNKLKGAITLALMDKSSGAEERFEGKLGNDGIIYLDVYIQEMRIPFKISIFPANPDSLRPAPKEITLLRSNETLTYSVFPAESGVARDLYHIFKDLELINDMGPYERIFETVTTSPLEGKPIWSELRALFENNSGEISPELLERIESYKKNSAMKQKWDKYCKRQKILELEWKKTVTAIVIFTKPIVEALSSDTPFIGDWMPELGRFL